MSMQDSGLPSSTEAAISADTPNDTPNRECSRMAHVAHLKKEPRIAHHARARGQKEEFTPACKNHARVKIIPNGYADIELTP